MLSEHVVKQQRKHKRDELRDDGVEGVGNGEVDRILGDGTVGNGRHAVAQIGDAALDSVAVGIRSGKSVTVGVGHGHGASLSGLGINTLEAGEVLGLLLGDDNRVGSNAAGGAVGDLEVDLGATHGDDQATDDKDAHDGSGTREGLHVGSQSVNSAGAKLIGPVHEPEAQSELDDVEDHQEDDRRSGVAVDGHVGGDAGRDRHERQPEQGVTDTTERAHCGDADGADRGDVNLVLLERKHDTHNKGDKERVGVEEQNAVKDYYIIKSKIEYKDEATGSSIMVLPDEDFSVNVLISYDSSVLSNQFATLDNMSDFPKEIASSRTFVFVREIEPLLSAGLIKGGDLDNAIVIYERKMSQESYDKLADVMGVPHMDADQLGYINHKPLVWPNECARHKLLDVIGDLALIGKPIKGRIIATRPGHTINNKFARQMRKEIRLHEIQAPTYDCNREPIMDVNRIRELLPHRYPFQLVDKVIEIGANYIVGVKNITANEPFFQGHFPQEPVMPGVLQVEAMAQVGGLLVLNSVDEPERYSTYFMKIDGVKFRQKVVPGDTLLFRVELLAPIRRGISTMKGYAFVGEKVVCEAEFMAQIVKNK